MRKLLAITLLTYTMAAAAHGAQQAYLKASNAQAGDELGRAVAIWGDTAVVGAPLEDGDATGVNGPQGGNSAPDSGAAYVYVRNGTTWSLQAYLKPANTGAEDSFGRAVAIFGDTLVIGAPGEDSIATGVNGHDANELADGAGAAYVFVRHGTTWSQQAYLKASNTGALDRFGTSVAIDGDTIVVGAPSEASNAVGVQGDGTNDAAPDAGAAYVFVRSGTTWSQDVYLKPSNTGIGDLFGDSVAVWRDTVVVGASGEDSVATDVGGVQAVDTRPNSGAAYVFVRNGTFWSQEAYLKASNTGSADNFGKSVAVSGDTALVGAPREDSSATGVNGNGADDGATNAGAVYVFERSGTTWSPQAYLKASNAGPGDSFGTSVALAGIAALIGAEFESSDATGVNGDEANDAATDAGGAYAFARSGATWGQIAYLKAANTGVGDSLGASVSLAGSTALVGAPSEDSAATTVNGDGANDAADGAGAAYVHALALPEVGVPYCFGDGSGAFCPCSPAPVPHGAPGKGCPTNVFAGGARAAATGLASLTFDTLVLGATEMINGSMIFYQGTTQQSGGAGLAFGDGLRCIQPTAIRRFAAKTVVGNVASYPGIGDAPVSSAGLVLAPGLRHYQGWYRSANPAFCTSATFNFTNGLSVTWIP